VSLRNVEFAKRGICTKWRDTTMYKTITFLSYISLHQGKRAETIYNWSSILFWFPHIHSNDEKGSEETHAACDRRNHNSTISSLGPLDAFAVYVCLKTDMPTVKTMFRVTTGRSWHSYRHYGARVDMEHLVTPPWHHLEYSNASQFQCFKN
jgi:hypothetical protein